MANPRTSVNKQTEQSVEEGDHPEDGETRYPERMEFMQHSWNPEQKTVTLNKVAKETPDLEERGIQRRNKKPPPQVVTWSIPNPEEG